MPDLLVEHDVPLAPFSTLGVGGAARAFVRAESIEAVTAAHQWAVAQSLPMFVLGGGSNLVIADAGFPGLVLQVALRGVALVKNLDVTILDAAAGEPWDGVVATAVEHGLAGLESLSGIPGSVGGTPIQNVGAYGQEVADTILSVDVFDRHAAHVITIPASECEFAYRMSRFKTHDRDRFIVCNVRFGLTSTATPPKYPDVIRYFEQAGITTPSVADVRAAVLAIRRGKGMVVDASDPDSRSVGSFFMNPLVPAAMREQVSSAAGAAIPAYVVSATEVKLPAAWLIERAGFPKGFVDGAVGTSSKHPLAIINRGGATARDVLRLAARIKRGVAERFGVSLRTEPIFVGFDGDPDVEYLRGNREL